MNGGRRPTTAPSSTRNVQKDGISESRSSNSRWEIWYYSLTVAFDYSVKVRLEVSGKGLT